MSEEDAALIVGALDSLAVALTEHDHGWTAGERCIYEAAVECVNRVNNAQLRARRIKHRQKYKLDCLCGFEGNTHNIRAHRSDCEIWHAQYKRPE